MNNNVLFQNERLNPEGFTQNIQLAPDCLYEFKMAAYDPGYGLDMQAILIDTSTGEEVFFQDIGWFAFLPRTEFSFEFNTPAQKDYRLELRIKTEKKESTLEIEYLSLRSLEYVEGLITYSHSIMRNFNPTSPVPGKLVINQLEMSGGLNQTLAQLFAIQADHDYENIHTQVTTPPALCADCFELRNIHKQVLPPAIPRNIKKGERLGWWLTFIPPENMVAGRHEGKITIYAGEKILFDLPLLLIIDDYHLPDADIAYLLYHSERYIPSRFLNEKLRRAYYEDMYRHGMNTITVYNNPDVDGCRIDFEHNWQFSEEELKLRNERGCVGMSQENQELWKHKFNFGLEHELKMIKAAGLGHKFPILLLAGKMAYSNDRNDWWGGMNPEQVVRLHEQWEHHWPRLLYYVIDEPTGFPDRTAKAKEILDGLKKQNCQIPTVSANIDEYPLGKYYDVWIQGVSRIDENMCRAAERNNAELWAYNCSASNQVMSQSRAMFGFWAARTGVKGVAQWAYYDARTEFCGKDDHSRCNLSRVGLSEDGPIPTVSWEAIREGVTDYRFVQLYRQKINELRKLPQNNQTQTLLEEGTKTYEKVIESVSFNLFAPLMDSGSFANRNEFNPVLGLGDQETIFEQKRQTLLNYIRKIDKYLKAIPESDIIK